MTRELATVEPAHRAAGRGARRRLALACALASACGGASAKPDPLRAAAGRSPGPLQVTESFWVPGEIMRWRVTVHGFEAANMVLVVGEPGVVHERRSIIVRSRASTAGVVRLLKEVTEEVTTCINLEGATPSYRQSIEKEGKRQVTVDARFRDSHIDYVSSSRGQPGRQWCKQTPAGEPIHDSMSILGLLRAWTPAEGARARYYALLDMELGLHTATFRRYETVRTALGAILALRFDVEVRAVTTDGQVGDKLRDQAYTVWISNDVHRRPLRMVVPHRLGRMKLEMIDYERPER
jgi:hypothetical protein